LSDANVYDDYQSTRSKYYPPDLVLSLDAIPANLDSTTTPTTWTDSVGNIPFTLHNGVAYNAGSGGYLTFQASSGRYADSTTGPGTLTKWSIEVWTYWNGQNTGSAPCIVSEKFTGGNINYMLGSADTGVDSLQAGFFNGGFHTTPSNYTLPTTSAWYQIVGTYDGGDINLYVNGVLVNTSHDPGQTVGASNSGINLMRRWDTPDYWGGRLSIVRIYNGDLGPARVLANYNASKSRFGLT